MSNQSSLHFFQKMFESAPSHQLADIISAIVNATFKEKLDVLNAVDLKDRYLHIDIQVCQKNETTFYNYI